MTYIGLSPPNTFTKSTSQTFTGNGSTTAFTLQTRVASPEDLEVFVSNVQQQPTESYTIGSDGVTMTFSEAPPSGTFYVIYRTVAQQAGTDTGASRLGENNTFTGTQTFNADVSFPDNVKAKFGTGNDFEIFHDGSNSIISETGTGGLRLKTNNFGTIEFNNAEGSVLARFIGRGNNQFFHSNSAKLETTSTGVAVTGNVDMNGGELILDADGDTSITADTDDEIHFKVAGDDHVKIKGGTNVLHVTEGSSGQGTPHTNSGVVIESDGETGINILSGTSNYGGIVFGDSGDADIGFIQYNHASNFLRFGVNTSEKIRIDSAGNFIVNSDDSTDTTTYNNTTGSHGPILHAETRLDIARSATQMTLNSTTSSSSTFIIFFRAGGEIGSITHNSASTVSYNAFTGSHWGRLSDNSKPTILKGTVLETIDEMCDWYEVEFTIPEVKYVDGDDIPKDKKVGDVKTEAQGKRYLVPLEDIGDKKVGDSFTFTYKDGVEYTGTLKLEDEEKHSKCKVSDVADSKRVYGVFFSWDSEDDGYNDMYVAGLGTYVVRVHKDVVVEGGDLLVSNGDGTAKLQDDDIIRTKTIGKVLTNIKQETYSDGSYTVPCALYCG